MLTQKISPVANLWAQTESLGTTGFLISMLHTANICSGAECQGFISGKQCM